MTLKIDTEVLIKKYKDGTSLKALADIFGTYPTTIKRILERNDIELRHDSCKKGQLYVKDGEKLIEWAKAQDRLVTKAELASVLGKVRLSPSYFIKYPELGQYVVTHEQNEIRGYTQQLYNWLQKNNIKYKPNDRTTLHSSLTALLLEDYKNIAIQLNIKPSCVSKKKHNDLMSQQFNKANEVGITIIFVKKEDFENLDKLKDLLDSFKTV